MAAQPVVERDLANLFDVSWASDHVGLEAYMQRMLHNCAGWFGASGVSLFLYQEHSGEYLLAAQAGTDARVPAGAVLRQDRGIAATCLAVGSPMLVNDPQEHPLLFGKVERRSDLGSAMVVPLRTPETGSIGVLNVSRPAGHPPFTKIDLGYAASLARHVALAISNARLFAKTNLAVSQAQATTQKLDAIIACLGVGVLVVDDRGIVTEWNPEVESLLGREIVAGSLLRNLIRKCPPELRRAVGEAYRHAYKGHRATRRATLAEGEQVWSIVASPLPIGGATLAVQDITEHERALRELSRVMRLAEIGQMTAAIAHEIRNPLTGIRTAAQMVQSLSEEAGEFGQIIEEEALKLNALCDQFLEFAKPLSLNLRETAVEALARSVIERHQAEFYAAGIRLRLETKPDLPTIECDPLRVEQVFRNLILNALQACKSGDRVNVEVEATGFAVKDTGEGIRPDLMINLFAPFFTTKASGTGLGLSTVRKIVDAHGWDIRVESSPAEGTAFRVFYRRATG